MHISPILNKYYEKGNFIASGRKVPRTGGVILAQAGNRQELDVILQGDLFFKAAVASYELTEFVPTKVAKDFELIESFKP